MAAGPWTDKTKGCGCRLATLNMVFKLARSTETRWRRLNGHELIGNVIAGITFTHGDQITHRLNASPSTRNEGR